MILEAIHLLPNSDIGFVRLATLNDIPYIVDLNKKETHSIGFIPKMAYESSVTGIKLGKRWSNVCNDKTWVCVCNGDLVGFCLSSFGSRQSIDPIGKIAQICLQSDARKLERGKLLLNSVIDYGKLMGVKRWSCGCADDLESNMFWRAMGWIKVGERKGISYHNTYKETSDRKVNLYLFDKNDMFTKIWEGQRAI